MTEPLAHKSTLAEIVVVSLLCLGLFIVGSTMVVAGGWAQHQSLADGSLASTIVFEVVLATLALTFLRLRKYPISRLRPTPTGIDTAFGIGLFVLGYLATVLAWSLVTSSNQGNDQPVAQMLQESHRSLLVVFALSVVNGLYEETFLLGYLMDALREQGASIAIGVTCLTRLLYHLYQGPVGALSITLWGVMMGLFYWRTKRLWPVVFAHQLTDLMALA